MGLNVDVLRSSFELVVETAPDLTSRFYEILFERYPQARPMFHRRPREQQAKMLTEALVAVVDHLEDAPWLSETLGAMGAKHLEYEVTDEMYGWVGESLLATLAEVAGEAWTDEVAQAWTDAYGAISSLMLAGAENARALAKTA
ncbi:MAG: globin domain-containing protein [Myxococcales bacterium]|nr:globin domain-containing protein [Myxococcales bacterium]